MGRPPLAHPPRPPATCTLAVMVILVALWNRGEACASFSATQVSSSNTWASLVADVDRNGLPDVFVCQDNGLYGCVVCALIPIPLVLGSPQLP